MDTFKNSKAIFILSILLLFIIPNYAYSAQPSQQAKFCTGIMTRPNLLSSINYTSNNGMITISIIIIAIMISIIGIAYGLGYGFNISQLKRFSKMELGEIIITVLIIIIFLSTSSVLNRFSTGNKNFVSLCNSLSDYSIELVPNMVYLSMTTVLYNLVQNLNISFTFDANSGPDVVLGGFSSKFGIQPFAGLSIYKKSINGSIEILTAILMLLLGVILFLSLIYSLFPIFFFAGIVLRTVPWTRSAGGALLGVFIGFYIFFPIVLGMMLPAIQNTNFNLNPPTFTSNPTASTKVAATTLYTILGGANTGITASLMGWFIDTVISPIIYAFVAIIISILLTLDFAETIGGLLGSPSLDSKGVLGRLI